MRGKVPESNAPEPPPVIEERTAPPLLPYVQGEMVMITDDHSPEHESGTTDTASHDDNVIQNSRSHMSSRIVAIVCCAITTIMIIGISMHSVMSSTDIVLQWILCVATILMIKEAMQFRYSDSCPRIDDLFGTLYMFIYIYASCAAIVTTLVLIHLS